MPVVENFELSFGQAGQASGTITSDGSLVTFTGVSGTVYEMDISPGSDYESGLISIKHALTGRFPVYQAGVSSRGSTGVLQDPGVAPVTVGTVILVDKILVVPYTDVIDGTPRTRTHTFSVVGDAIKIRIDGDGSTDLLSNYSGLYGGVFSGAGMHTLEAPGSLNVPQAYWLIGNDVYWYAHFIDITRSHAQDFVLTNPASGSLAATYSTMHKYVANTAGVLPETLGETMWCITSTKRRDTFLHPNDGTTHREEIAAGPWCFLTSKGSGWVSHASEIAKQASWGVKNLNIYPQFWWAYPNYTSGGQDNGSSWRAGDPTLQAQFGASVTALGYDVGVYTYNSLEKEGTENYDSTARVLNADGTPRTSVWEAGTWMRKQELVIDKFTAQFTSIATDLLLSFVRFDVDTYTGLTGGGGNYVDADASSVCQTMETALQERRRWQYACKAVIGGWAFGEGGRATYTADLELLYAGAIDSHHTWLNTNSGYAEVDPLYPEAKTISNWPMMLEHEWYARNPYFQHTNNNPARFFTVWDSGLQDPSETTIYPHSRAMMDRLRCYAVSLRRTGAAPLSTTWSGFMPEAEVVKEYYITNAVCRAVVAHHGETVIVHYHDDTNGFETEDERFARGEATGVGRGRLEFVETRVRIQVGAMQLFVNRSTTDWALSTILPITLPPDGYFVVDGPNYYGSFKSADLTSDQRVDVAYVSGEYFLVDGRGTEVTYLGVQSPSGQLYMEDYARSFTILEDTSASVVPGALPAQNDMSNAYATVTEADTYNSDYTLDSNWTASTTAAKERALRLATQYIDARFGLIWQGYRSTSTQVLDWPRNDVNVGGYLLSSTALPSQLVNATCELAVKAVTAPELFKDETTPGTILEHEVTADSVRERTKYAGGRSQQVMYTLAYKILRPLTNSSMVLRS